MDTRLFTSSSPLLGLSCMKSWPAMTGLWEDRAWQGERRRNFINRYQDALKRNLSLMWSNHLKQKPQQQICDWTTVGWGVFSFERKIRMEAASWIYLHRDAHRSLMGFHQISGLDGHHQELFVEPLNQILIKSTFTSPSSLSSKQMFARLFCVDALHNLQITANYLRVKGCFT